MSRLTHRVGRLHVIISEDRDGSWGRSPFSPERFLAATLRGGADSVQYRRKSGTFSTWIDQGRPLREIAAGAGVPFLVNDHLDLARELAADGVHLGLHDTPISVARNLLPANAIVGGTARTLLQVEAARDAGADYVGFGPVWSTSSKQLDVEPRGLERLEEVSREGGVPIVAIGGVTVERAGEAVRAGAWGVAVIGELARAVDPTDRAERLIGAMRRGLAEG